jgi:hypothetical protein
MQNESQPILWTLLQTDAYVINNEEGDNVRKERASVKIHGVGPTGLLNSDETADWEEDYRFLGALGDYVGFIISVNYEAGTPWDFQTWGSIPKMPRQKTTAQKTTRARTTQ